MKSTAVVVALAVGGMGLADATLANAQAPRATNPVHEELKTQADQAYQKGDYRKVIELSDRVLREAPRDHVALYLRGSARVEVGLATGDNKLVRTGIADSREAIQFGGAENINYYLPYLSGMTRLARVENRPEHGEVAEKVATDLLDKLTTLKPEDRANIYYQRGTARIFLRNTAGAVADFEEALKLQPQHLGASLGIAEAYVASGELDKAEDAYALAARNFPNSPLVFNNRGMFLQHRGKLERAQQDFTRTIELDPNYVVAYINRGYNLLNAGQAAAAENDFTQALRINPNQPMVYSGRARARVAQGKVQEALSDQQRVVELDPQSALAQADLGFTRFFGQNYAAALQAFDKAVQLNAELNYLAPWQYWCMVRTGQQSAAQTRFSEVLAKKTDERTWAENLLAYLAGRLDAQALMEAMVADNPQIRSAQLCEAHYFIGLRESAAGNSKEAATHFRQALETRAMHLSAYRGSQIALDRLQVAERR